MLSNEALGCNGRLVVDLRRPAAPELLVDADVAFQFQTLGAVPERRRRRRLAAPRHLRSSVRRR